MLRKCLSCRRRFFSRENRKVCSVCADLKKLLACPQIVDLLDRQPSNEGR